MARYPSITKLKDALGSDYKVCFIDLEKCLYRDFGNGFNAEICGVSFVNRGKPATVYLWFSGMRGCHIVKTVRNVGRSAAEIAAVVDSLYDYSQELLANGYSDEDGPYNLIQNM